MDALVIHSAGDLRVEDVPTPPVLANQLRVRVRFGGICGSDLHYFQHGGFGTVRVTEPMVLGHEVAHVARGHGLKAIKKSRWGGVSKKVLSKASTYTPAEISALTDAFGGAMDDMVDSLLVSGYAPGLDYRGRGGYVAIPPSVGPQQRRYAWITRPALSGAKAVAA